MEIRPTEKVLVTRYKNRKLYIQGHGYIISEDVVSMAAAGKQLVVKSATHIDKDVTLTVVLRALADRIDKDDLPDAVVGKVLDFCKEYIPK